MIFFFGGLKWAQSFDQSPGALARLQRRPPGWGAKEDNDAGPLGGRQPDPPFAWEMDSVEPQTERNVSGSWYFRLVWTSRKQKTTSDEVVELESPEKQLRFSMPLKSKKRPRGTGKPEAMKPEQLGAPVAEPGNESSGDSRPLPESSPFQDDVVLEDFPEPLEFITAIESGRRRQNPNGYTPYPKTGAVDDVEYEFVKEESSGGPYERTDSMSGFRLAKERAIQEAFLRGVSIDANHEVDLNVRGCAQLAHPVMDNTGVLVTPSLHIYQLLAP
jgi:hypothetical protein